MTKKQKKCILIVLCLFIALIIGMIYYLFFSGIILFPTYSECKNYEEFDSIEADFERIVEIVKENGNGHYIMINGLSKKDDGVYNDINLNKNDVDKIKRIMEYSCLNTNNKWCLSDIIADDDYIRFKYDPIGCGIVKTSDISWYIKEKTNNECGYNNLHGDWYAVYC